ncbi:MAG: phage terminase small subunit P27 family [Isosphaeraceae bacterium]
MQSWDAPPHLSEFAKAEFVRTVDLLTTRGMLEQADREIVVRRAEMCDVARTCYQQIERDGLFVTSDRGNVSSHPATKLHATATAEIRAIDTALKLTPASVKGGSKESATGSGYSQWNRYLGGTSDGSV